MDLLGFSCLPPATSLPAPFHLLSVARLRSLHLNPRKQCPNRNNLHLHVPSASSNGAPFLRETSPPIPSHLPELPSDHDADSYSNTIASSSEDAVVNDDLSCSVPSCPVPDFSISSSCVTLLNPCKLLPESSHYAELAERPLLVYVPGMDCTGHGIRNQLPYLFNAGYDVRCVYIPSSDRSSWEQLVEVLIPLLKEEQVIDGRLHHMTLLGESFGGHLALRLAQAAPDIISRLVLVNPATNFQKSSPFASFCSSTGLLATFPEALYKAAQDILLPLMVNHNRVEKADNEDMLSPVDYVPAACAAWRFSLLNDNTGLSDEKLRSINVPTLVLSSAEDHVLSSVEEGGRLQRLLPSAKRIILPHSGHTALLEAPTNLAIIMEAHGFQPPKSALQTASLGAPSEAPSFIRRREEILMDEKLDELGRMLEPWRILTSPLVSGEENLPNPEAEPKRPLLFVGNHTMFGVYDTPILFHELFLRGFRCRGLAHPGHWRTGAGQLFERYGHVKATKFAAYRLLQEGESVLLFPGGAREVCKRKGEQYKLLWKPTTDFVRMASRFNAIIIPFGTVGGDDAYKILMDANELLESPLGPLVRDLYTRLDISMEYIYPVTAFPGTNIPSLLATPSIERIYFHFAEPIDTAKYDGSLEDRDKYNTLYLLVKERVERSINLLKQVQSNDKERALQKRLLGKVSQLLPKFNRT